MPDEHNCSGDCACDKGPAAPAQPEMPRLTREDLIGAVKAPGMSERLKTLLEADMAKDLVTPAAQVDAEAAIAKFAELDALVDAEAGPLTRMAINGSLEMVRLATRHVAKMLAELADLLVSITENDAQAVVLLDMTEQGVMLLLRRVKHQLDSTLDAKRLARHTKQRGDQAAEKQMYEEALASCEGNEGLALLATIGTWTAKRAMEQAKEAPVAEPVPAPEAPPADAAPAEDAPVVPPAIPETYDEDENGAPSEWKGGDAEQSDDPASTDGSAEGQTDELAD